MATKETVNVPALAEKYTHSVELRVKDLQQNRQIDIPSDFSVANALRSAYLILQEVEDKNHKPALDVCTPTSVENALFEMLVAGLNPAKNQGYFLVYGNKLVFQKSYFGSIALSKRARPEIKDIVCEPIYAGDSITIKIVKGKKVVEEHQQTLESIAGEKIRGGYAMAIDHNGEIMKSVIMTMDEVKQAWKMSKMYPITDAGEIKPGSTHKKFTASMVRRTIIGRLCKEIINTSSDKNLLESINRAEGEKAASIVSAEIDADANMEPIDIDQPGEIPAPAKPAAVSKPEPEPVPKPVPKPEPEPATEEISNTESELQLDPEENPKWVADLCAWLDEVKADKALLDGRFATIRKDVFARLCETDQARVLDHYNELTVAKPKSGKKAQPEPEWMNAE